MGRIAASQHRFHRLHIGAVECWLQYVRMEANGMCFICFVHLWLQERGTWKLWAWAAPGVEQKEFPDAESFRTHVTVRGWLCDGGQEHGAHSCS